MWFSNFYYSNRVVRLISWIKNANNFVISFSKLYTSVPNIYTS